MLTWAQKTGRGKKMPWTTPERGRGFVPPGKKIYTLPIYERPKYGGWVKPTSGRWQLYGFGDDIAEAKKQADIAKWKEEAISKTAQQKAERYKKAWWKPEAQIYKQEAESAALRASGALAEAQQAKNIYTATKAFKEADKAIEDADKVQTIPAYQKALSIVTRALNEVNKTGDTAAAGQLLSQIDEIKKAIASLVEYEREKAAYEAEMKAQEAEKKALPPRLRHKFGMEGLGKSFFKKIFSKPSELKQHLKKSAPTPKKIKARMKTGLKLMKIALKPSGAKLLAKKGGMKAAVTNPDKFIGMYNQKLHERNEKRKEEQMEQEQASVQPAETYEVEGKIYTREEFIAALGMTPEQYESGEIPSVSPVEEQPQPIYTDDPNMPSLPPQPVPTATEPAPSVDYPAEEYYPDESAAMDYTMYPDEYTYEEEPYYQGYDISQKSEVIKGTEWYYEQPFDAQRINYMQEDQPVEYEEYQSEAINPNADWYRNVREYPHTEEETGYIPPVSFRQKASPEYSRGIMKPSLSGYGLKQIKKRTKYFPEGYMPMRPRPVSPEFTRLTKTYKYEPDEITNIPVPVSRSIKMGWQRNRGF